MIFQLIRIVYTTKKEPRGGEPKVPSHTLLRGLNGPYLLSNLLRKSNIFLYINYKNIF